MVAGEDKKMNATKSLHEVSETTGSKLCEDKFLVPLFAFAYMHLDYQQYML